MKDTAHAFVALFDIEGAADGPLSGLTFGAKDIYDVAGHVTGCGSPEWGRTHLVPDQNAAPVAALLASGARLVGKTHTDEIAYSLMGVNAHYGTPLNTAAPDRLPGGSSSGSAAAVAAGLVDIGLGSDTGGSVRLPASFCGIYGLRTTHGQLSLVGTMPLAPSFDTVGWFARDLATLDRVAEGFGLPVSGEMPVRLLLPVDSWAHASAATVDAMASSLARLEAAYGPATPMILAPEGLGSWFEAFRVCQAAEIWQTHGAWVESEQPQFGPGIADRFRMAASITPSEWAEARRARSAARTRLVDILGDGAMLVLPTGPGPAPFRNADNPTLDAFRTHALHMLCPAGLAGLPQISLPAGTLDGAPVGLSLVAAAGRDRTLLAVARAV
jgi:amidase